jgi:hypothetical protein
MTSTDRLSEVADQAFTFLLEAPSLKVVDDMLWRLNGASNALECDVLAMWLRATCGFVPELPAWKPLYDQTTLLCNHRGINAADLLYGLNQG